MSGALTLSVCFLAGLSVWLLGLRAYLQHHGGSVRSGATWWVSAWADWQECCDFARTNRDSCASAWARLFILTQIGGVVGIA